MRRQIRALMIGAHPDDCEYLSGGLAVKMRSQGHIVRFVSVTNGEAGHHRMSGTPLVQRRREEARCAAGVLGIEHEVLDHPDGRLEADLATREQIIGLIRRFQPDLVFTHRPNDYHPDHRRVGTLVQDSSYLIRVPNICPLVPPLSIPPIILYFQDVFQRPVPFSADVVVAIDDVMGTKVQALHCHESQFYEWLPYADGNADEVPMGEAARLAWLGERHRQWSAAATERCREALVLRYREEAGREVRYAEAFEVSEYGRPLPSQEVNDWFPL
jgi:LmbE family N-acetylglucosaminyl deacetylase